MISFTKICIVGKKKVKTGTTIIHHETELGKDYETKHCKMEKKLV